MMFEDDYCKYGEILQHDERTMCYICKGKSVQENQDILGRAYDHNKDLKDLATIVGGRKRIVDYDLGYSSKDLNDAIEKVDSTLINKEELGGEE